MPRVMGTRCGVKSTCTVSPATRPRACSISAVCLCVSRPYALTCSFASEKRLVAFSDRPAPDTPEQASTTIPTGSTRPAASRGASARLAAVG